MRVVYCLVTTGIVKRTNLASIKLKKTVSSCIISVDVHQICLIHYSLDNDYIKLEWVGWLELSG